MKPDNNKETITKMTTNNKNANATVSKIKQQSIFSMTDIEYFQYKMRGALQIEHEPAKCLMCNNSYRAPDEKVCSMGYASFEWHLKSLFNSNGQRPNREVIRDMWAKYQEIINSLRRNSKISKQAMPVVVTIGVSA